MRIKTYIINLKESGERRNYILKETRKYPFMDIELVEGIDGRKLSEKEKQEQFDGMHFQDRYHGRVVLPGEIGCTLSHYKCLQLLLESDEQVALVVEDDASWCYPDRTAAFYEAGLSLIASGKADVILSVPRCIVYRNKATNINGFNFCPLYAGYSTCSYLINRKAAKQILDKNTLPSTVADDWRAIRKLGVSIYVGAPVICKGLSDPGGNVESIIQFKEQYTKVPLTWRFLSYRIKARLSFYFCRLANRLGLLSHISGAKFSAYEYINISNGL